MKDYLIFGILLYINKNRKTTANNISKEFGISTRSVYRYIDSLSLLGIPITTKQGKGGGIEIVGDSYIDKLLLNSKDKEIIQSYLNNKTSNAELCKVLKKII